MNEQVILQSKIYRWVMISLFVICPVFYLSVLVFPILFLILAASFPLLLLFELATKGGEKNWPSFLCLSWLILAVPTFGIMPLLIAWGVHRFLPMGKQLDIFTGFTLTAAYNDFIPSPELYQWDHPFPPLTELQLNLLGGGTLLVSLLPIWILKKRGLLKFNRRPQFQNRQ
ncbi:MAG TPA: hypothetical protein VE715_15620 [Blastocatellia bacterium]|nr:hypothetical protein [Blastocatellia bacterium]